MSIARISSAVRREVRERTNRFCEYCLLPEEQAFFPPEPDHIIATKHGGKTNAENLALACFDCNRFKGSDVASIDPLRGELTPLFNPRTQKWDEHFTIEGGHCSANGRRSNNRTRFEIEPTESRRGARNACQCRALSEAAADLVTEMTEVKHPFQAGIRAQRGIEF